MAESKGHLSSFGSKLKYLCIFSTELAFSVGVVGVVVDMADIDDVIEINQVLPQHKEDSVVVLDVT